MTLHKAIAEFPSELGMAVTDIVLNKEPYWSRRLETLLTTKLSEEREEGKKEGAEGERERLEPWLRHAAYCMGPLCVCGLHDALTPPSK